MKRGHFYFAEKRTFLYGLDRAGLVSVQLLPVGCHPERSEGSNNLEILRLSASE